MEPLTYPNPSSLGFVGPEVILILGLVATLVVEAARGSRRSGFAAPLVAILAVVGALWTSLGHYGPGAAGLAEPVLLFQGALGFDPLALFFKVLFLVATGIALLFGLQSPELDESGRAEFSALVLAVCLGAMLLGGAADLLMIYLAIELVSIPSYLLAGFAKGTRRSTEAALKYVIYGAVASGAMIYGFSLLYGLTGETSLVAIGRAMPEVLASPAGKLAGLLAILLSFVGFGYKIAAVPFHMWCPDVYEGAPLPATAFFSIVPKAAGFAALIRFFYIALAGEVGSSSSAELGVEWTALGDIQWPWLLAAVSAVTMTLGNLSAIPQTNVKRLLAYSSIAHAGYVLMGLVLLTQEGLTAMIFYLVVYLFMNLGAFLVLMLVANKVGGEGLDDLRGLAWRGGGAAYLAVLMGLFVFALTGLPPTAGFIGKFYLFKAVVDRGLYWLALVAVLNSVVSLYYYARIIQAMFLDSPQEGATETPRLSFAPGGLLLASGLAIPVLLLGIYWEPLTLFTRASLRFTGFH